MADRRLANGNWQVADENGRVPTWDRVAIAVLMDLRDRLDVTNRRLSALECPNFVAIPHTLTRLERNTRKPAKKRAKRSAK
jgi:hypothetical protein